MAPRITRRVFIETYFELIGDKAKCKLCSHTLKSNRIFNLKTHVIKVHRIKENDLKGPDVIKTAAVNPIIERKSRRQVVKIEINKHEFFRSYIGLVIEESVPFSFLDTENFKNLIDPICRGLSEKLGKNICVNSRHCKKIIKLVSDNVRNDIASDLNQQLFCLKIDSAIGLPQKFSCISAQFMKNGEIQTRLLGVVELHGVGANSCKELGTDILNILNKYDLNLNQIISITSDNGENLITATFFEDEKHVIKPWDDRNEMFIRKMQQFEDSAQINLNDIHVTRYVAYTAQLCALDVTKDREIKNFLFACRNFVKYLRNPSNGFWEMFELKGLTLPQLDCPTTWGSTYSMIMSLKNAKDILIKIEPIENGSIDENFELSEHFWDFIKAYCIVFEPLQLIMVKLKEEQLHYGSFYAEWLKCKLCTEKIYEKCENTDVKKLANILLESMESISEKLLNNESLLAALYLDPRFNHTLKAGKRQEATTYLKKLHNKIKNINAPFQEIKTEAPCTSADTENIEFSQKADEYLNEYLSKSFLPNGNEEPDITSKIENLQLPFLRVDSNVIHFWREKRNSDPELYALSNICFAIPTAHVTLENDFSCMKWISTDCNNKMMPNILENVLLVKYNEGYLEQAIDTLPLFDDDQY